MNKRWFASTLVILLFSCASKKEAEPAPSPVPTSNLPDSFFPVTSYIKGQIHVLDSLPITPLEITVVKGRTDSAWLTKEKLKPLLQPFLYPIIDETNLLPYFTETRFNDQTINAITFTYEPSKKLPDSISLRRWDVYIDPEKGMVTKIYLVKQLKENGQNITQQLTWQTDRSAKISTILNKTDGSLELLKEDQFIWNFQ
ncbi:MAG: hypothetical protein ABIN67_01400 [Ferruginibacter sp.]